MIPPLLPDRLIEDAIALRRDLHRHPEPSGKEFETASRVEAFLRAGGLVPRRVAGTGVLADLGEGDDRLLFRADLDALEIQEETGLPFSSTVPGMMHACGHDVHTAILAGLARQLAKDPHAGGAYRFCFQPSEETLPGGAEAVIREGALEGVSAAAALHVYPQVRVGQVSLREGIMMANADDYDIEITGAAAHAAEPHAGRDAGLAAADFVHATQTIVSRRRNPFDPLVVTFGTLRAGTKRNIIAGHARIEATVRSLTEETRLAARKRLVELGESVAHRHDLSVEVRFAGGYPAVMNHPGMTELLRRSAASALGADAVLPLAMPSLGGEDFARFGEKVPAVFFRLGSGDGEETRVPHHAARFQVDERAIGHGIAVFAELARRWALGERP